SHNLIATTPYNVGYWNFVLVSYNGAGNQVAYVNGSAIATITNGGAATFNFGGHLNLGPSLGFRAGSIHLPLAQVAHLPGYAPTSADNTALYNRTSTPGTLGTPATRWWTLGGTAGATANPVSDAGFIDRIGGTQHFSTPSAGGPLAGSAVYLSDTPAAGQPQ